MSRRALHIAWLGPAPGEDSGVPGVTTALITGLADLGHRIECFLPSAGHQLPERVAGDERIVINWGTSRWSWDRWYSRTRITAYLSGFVIRGLASVRLRRAVVRRHREDPFDVVYQFSTIESPAVPLRLIRTVPLVLHPETHGAGELRALIAERRLARRGQPAGRYATVLATMALRTALQRRRIRRARLLVCISGVFRDHLVADYHFPRERTVVVPNPVRLERFDPARRHPAEGPPVVLVLGRIAVRKGIQDVLALANVLLSRGVPARIHVAGGPSLWSDYTPLLADLPPENAEYLGMLDSEAVAEELQRCDVLLQPSRYEPFALTVAEALAAGVPVVATSEVGAIERVGRSVSTEVAPGDVGAMADAIAAMLERVAADRDGIARQARAEAERLYAQSVVCAGLSDALVALADG